VRLPQDLEAEPGLSRTSPYTKKETDSKSKNRKEKCVKQLENSETEKWLKLKERVKLYLPRLDYQTAHPGQHSGTEESKKKKQVKKNKKQHNLTD